MAKLQPVRGTRDIFGEDARRMQHVVDTFRRVGHLYGFEDLATPIFEFTEVFRRPLGESSDVVTKEMYSFTDRGGEEITLRPEFTAAVCRAFISNGMAQHLPCRLMSHGPAFRYERPQKGRFRQFHQINAEFIGVADPEADVDLIAMAHRLLAELGIADKVTLHLNTLGDKESRSAYREELVAYLKAHEKGLSQDSQRRLSVNPLRILDSKDEGDKSIVANAPRLSDSLNSASKDFFARVQEGLAAAGIACEHDERLVRGLDYYTHTAFEFITGDLGSQGSVLAGGRYDGLIEQLGGPQTPGVGWAGGIDRLALMLAAPASDTHAFVVMPFGADERTYAISVMEQIRLADGRATFDQSGNMGKRLGRAAKSGARYAVLIGSDEVAAQSVVVKDLTAGEQVTIPRDQIAMKVERNDF